MHEIYEARLARFLKHRDREEVLGHRLGWARALVFTAGVICYLGWDIGPDPVATACFVGMLLALGLFLALVIWHRKVRARRNRADTLVNINEEALSRIERDWKVLPPARYEAPDRRHPYALDLDISGEASLFRLLTTPTLPPGRDTLREWLLRPSAVSEVRKRQEGVRELAPQVDLRQTLEAEGRGVHGPSAEQLQEFISWAEGESWLPNHLWVLWVARALPSLTIVLLGLSFVGILGHPWWLLGLAGGYIFGTQFRREIHPLMDRAAAGQEQFERYARILDLLLGAQVNAEVLRGLQEAVRRTPVGAREELRRLGRRVAWADVRHSSMAHVPLQALLVWDVHMLAVLERWKAGSGFHVRTWLRALGELEALSALASLKCDHPDWTFPVFSLTRAPGLSGEALGHPLLPQAECVRNDVTLGPPGTFLFVTGSNMSGKSTLLRAMGLNVILAQAGGPVCARGLELSPLRVHTSMRTTDSLSDGVSQYMAELRRIREVVESARARDADPTLYLLDEPLQGTNEAERRVAVQTILEHLLEAGAVGAVATHDLALDDTPRLSPAARPVHFTGEVREEGAGPLITFDYRLRAHRATSTNALALLRAVGLGREGPRPGSRDGSGTGSDDGLPAGSRTDPRTRNRED